ncbi:MAG: DHA2 family efflux MFS transporter permease subunit [Hyphomonadaceae bacterium]
MSGAPATGAPSPDSADWVPPQQGTPEYTRLNIGFFAMVIGMFMAILDIQIVAASIAEIQAGVSASADEIAWVQTSYLIAEVIGIPLSGLLNRAFGMRVLFCLSAAAFVVSSMLCALAWNLDSLVVFRCIQGFAGSAMIPTTMAAAFSLFGPNRSMLQQVMIGMVATLAPSIGPTLGGWVSENTSWHWLFLINVVPGIVSLWLVWNFLPRSRLNLNLLRRIDVIGLGAMALFLGSFEWVFEEGPSAGWFEDGELVMWMVICAGAGMVFFWRAATHQNPVVNLKVFTDRNFAVGSLLVTVVGFGLFGTVYIMPLFLGQVRGLNAMQIGMIMSVGGIGMFIGGPIAGALIRKIDPRIVLVIGLILTTIGLWWNHYLSVDSGFYELFWPQMLRGAGIIMSMVPVNFLALGTLSPPQLPNATGLITVCRNIGGAVGLAALNTMRLNFNNLHQQEISAGLDPTRPEVYAYLQQVEAKMRLMGDPDPHRAALIQLAQRMKLESAIMTFGDMFLAMTICFALMFLLVPLVQKPVPRQGPAPAGH